MAISSDVSAPERPSRPAGDAPRTIRVHPDDNVAIVVNAFGLPAGTTLPEGITLREFVPQGHKVALVDITEGGAVRRYGEIVGLAIAAIPAGSWVEESRVETPAAPDLASLDLTIRPPAPLPRLDGYTFEGFRNPDGTVGTKNILAISTSVQCVAGTLDVAIRRIKDELLPRFPNVDDVVGLTHTYGCGVAINAPEADIPIRTLQNIARNPNFGGEVMVVGLGCETGEGEFQEIRRLFDAGDGDIPLAIDQRRAARFDLFQVADVWAVDAVADGEDGVGEVREHLAAREIVDGQRPRERAFRRVRENEYRNAVRGL